MPNGVFMIFDERKMNNTFTKNDIVCRNFQIGKFNIKKIVPAVSMRVDINIDNLLSKRRKINEKSIVHVTIYQFLVKVIADILINYPLLYSLFYKSKIIYNSSLLINVPVSVDNHVEYIVVKNPNEKTVEDVALEIQKGIENIKSCSNVLMQSLIDMSKINKIQRIIYKLKNYKNPVYFMNKYYGYFPITNFGTFNVKIGTTVISEPVVSAMVIGKSENRLTLSNSSVRENIFLPVTLSFDHRVMDGAYAGNFLNDLKNYIENL